MGIGYPCNLICLTAKSKRLLRWATLSGPTAFRRLIITFKFCYSLLLVTHNRRKSLHTDIIILCFLQECRRSIPKLIMLQLYTGLTATASVLKKAGLQYCTIHSGVLVVMGPVLTYKIPKKKNISIRFKVRIPSVRRGTDHRKRPLLAREEFVPPASLYFVAAWHNRSN